jgi:hypothetical protein
MYKLLPILLFAYGLAVTTADIYDNSWALIIGINDYDKVYKLHYAVEDAELIQEILIKDFDFPISNISIIKNQHATKQNILKEFSKITRSAEKNDRVIIFFAGHGDTFDLPGGGEMGYLIPVDGNLNDLYFSSIGMAELKNLALMSKAKHVLYLIDACYSGLAVVGSRGLDPSNTNNYIDKIIKNNARQIITAGGKGEKVIEKSEWGHSAFTLNLRRGLRDGNADINSDGYITGNELGMFLEERVTIDSDNLQTPHYGRMTSEEGEFVFKVPDSELTDNEDINISSHNESDNLILQQITQQLKESSELNQRLLKQFKDLDNEYDNNENSNQNIDQNNSALEQRLIKNTYTEKNRLLSLIYPGLGFLSEQNYKKGIKWSGLFSGSLIANYLLHNTYKKNNEFYRDNISMYETAIGDFNILREKISNSNNDLVQSKNLVIAGWMTSGVLWYLSYNDYIKYHDEIVISLSNSKLKVTFIL